MYKVKLSSSLSELHDKELLVYNGMRVVDVKKCIIEGRFVGEERKTTMIGATVEGPPTTTEEHDGGDEEVGEEGSIIPEVEKLRLIHRGRIMRDGELMETYHVKEDDRLHVVAVKEKDSKDSGSMSSPSSMNLSNWSSASTNSLVPPEMKLLGDMMKVPEFKVSQLFIS
jgi:hypothetical protein